MGLSNFFRKLFGRRDEHTQGTVDAEHRTTNAPLVLSEISTDLKNDDYKIDANWTSQIRLSSNDLLHMAQKLKSKGEFYRAEQLLRDGVKEALDSMDYWELLLEIEEPLNRKGRAYYCLEKILTIDPENENAQEKFTELQAVVDNNLAYYIEYKLAPEFYKLQ